MSGARAVWTLPLLAFVLAVPAAGAVTTDWARETVNAARAADDRLQLATVQPQAHQQLTAALDRLVLVQGRLDDVSWRTLGRMHNTMFVPSPSAHASTVPADMETVMSYVSSVLLPQYAERFGEPAADSAFAPFDSLVKRRHEAAFVFNQAALGRYERKYGPGSARLNLLEIGLNHFAQGSPWFGPGDHGPGPLEWVAGYSTTYASWSEDRGTAISVLETGVRWYFFAPGWGAEAGWKSYLKPRFATVGVVVASARDGALRPPFDPGKKRIGPFVSWGGVKFAWLAGDEQRWLVSRQIQLIPNLF